MMKWREVKEFKRQRDRCNCYKHVRAEQALGAPIAKTKRASAEL